MDLFEKNDDSANWVYFFEIIMSGDKTLEEAEDCKMFLNQT